MNTQRIIYPTRTQKRKLIKLVMENPQLVTFKVSQGFNYQDSQRLWQSITTQCNALPGARKTWKQWRKTYQDIRSKAKRQQRDMNGEIPESAKYLSRLEREVMGYKVEEGRREPSSESSEHDHIEQEQTMLETNYTEEINSDEPKSPPETKVFQKQRIMQRIRNKPKPYPKSDSNGYLPNYDLLASQEQEKIRMKVDFVNFKKDYFRQKLKHMKEQTEALKSIAMELAK